MRLAPTLSSLPVLFCAAAALLGQASDGENLALPRFGGLGPATLESKGRPASVGEVDARRLAPRAKILSVEKIWDAAPHNAFTDLRRFRERWYCTFREGSAHVSPDGAVRVISSADSTHWSTAFHVQSEYADVRDPKLSITADGRLMLSAMAAYNPPTEINYQTLAWYTLDGRSWGEPFKIGDPEFWLWQISWHRNSAYSMAYSTRDDRFLRLYVGPGGFRFQRLSDRILADGSKPSEASLLFANDDSALCLVRRDGEDGNTHLGYGRPPYRSWEWTDLGQRLASPVLIRLHDDRLLAAGRLYDGRQRTSLCWLDAEEGTLREFLTLPSGGDNGYPGLVFHDDLLWVSYYSSHDGRAAIYLAKIRLPERPEKRKPDTDAVPIF